MQFHPETCSPPHGKDLLQNFLGMPNPVLTEAIDRLAGGEDLPADEAAARARRDHGGRRHAGADRRLPVALRTKGETAEEIAGLRARCARSPCGSTPAALVDTVGTGGDGPTFNISTIAAFVAAGAGAGWPSTATARPRASAARPTCSRRSGARIDLEPEAVAACSTKSGFGFMFAPRYHPAMQHVVPVRKALGVRTVFNLLGPLTNPAGARRQVIGVSDRGSRRGRRARRLGTDRAR